MKVVGKILSDDMSLYFVLLYAKTMIDNNEN